jgi:hypothetical protein
MKKIITAQPLQAVFSMTINPKKPFGNADRFFTDFSP